MMGNDGFEDDSHYDDGVPHGTVLITPGTGSIRIEFLSAPTAMLSASGTSFAVPKIAEQVNVPVSEESADLLWTPVARLIMSPSRYRGEWLQHISDMNFERHECLKRGDPTGARRAMIRAHLYSLPRWLLFIPGGFILNFLRHWFGF
jgi:hypothetical protein